MITSNAHPEDDPRGEEVLVGGTVVMTRERERFESPAQAYCTVQLPSILGVRRCLRYRRDPRAPDDIALVCGLARSLR